MRDVNSLPYFSWHCKYHKSGEPIRGTSKKKRVVKTRLIRFMGLLVQSLTGTYEESPLTNDYRFC